MVPNLSHPMTIIPRTCRLLTFVLYHKKKTFAFIQQKTRNIKHSHGPGT